MIKIIMTREMIKIDIDQIAEKEGHQAKVVISMDRVIEEDYIMSISIEMTTEGIILGIYKIIEVKILEMGTEGNIEMIILEQVGVDLGTDNIQIISEGMTEVVIGLDQVQEPVLVVIELNAISVGNMIILLSTVQLHR